MKKILYSWLSIVLILTMSIIPVSAEEGISTFYGDTTQEVGGLSYNINPNIPLDDESESNYHIHVYQSSEDVVPILEIMTQSDGIDYTEYIQKLKKPKQFIRSFVHGIDEEATFSDLKSKKIKKDGAPGFLCTFVINDTYATKFYIFGTEKGLILAAFIKDKTDPNDYEFDKVFDSIDIKGYIAS